MKSNREFRLIRIEVQRGWNWYIFEDNSAWNLMLEATAYGSLMFCYGGAIDNGISLEATIKIFRNNIIKPEGNYYKQDYLNKLGDGESIQEYEKFIKRQG